METRTSRTTATVHNQRTGCSQHDCSNGNHPNRGTGVADGILTGTVGTVIRTTSIALVICTRLGIVTSTIVAAFGLLQAIQSLLQRGSGSIHLILRSIRLGIHGLSRLQRGRQHSIGFLGAVLLGNAFALEISVCMADLSTDGSGRGSGEVCTAVRATAMESKLGA